MATRSGALSTVELSIAKAAQVILRSPLEIPVMMWSDTGTGKSEIVKQVADSIREGYPQKTLIAQVLTPVDLMGIPILKEEERLQGRPVTEFTLPLVLPHTEVDGDEGIFFFDELPNAPRTVQAAIQSLLTRGEFNGYVWPEGWKIVLAGNRMSHKANTFEMPRPVRNRLMHLYVGYDVDAFLAWGAGAKGGITPHEGTPFPKAKRAREEGEARIHPIIRAFIRNHRDMIHSEVDTYEAFSTPRSLEYASWVLETEHDPELRHIMIQGLIGPSAGAQFQVFLNDASILPNPADILSGKVKLEKVVADGVRRTQIGQNGTVRTLEPSQLFVLSSSLSGVVKGEKQLERFFEVVMQMPMEYTMVAVTELQQRLPELIDTEAFTQWAVENASSHVFR